MQIVAKKSCGLFDHLFLKSGGPTENPVAPDHLYFPPMLFIHLHYIIIWIYMFIYIHNINIYMLNEYIDVYIYIYIYQGNFRLTGKTQGKYSDFWNGFPVGTLLMAWSGYFTNPKWPHIIIKWNIFISNSLQQTDLNMRYTWMKKT